MIKAVLADLYVAKGEGARGILEGLRNEARDALILRIVEASKKGSSLERYRDAKEEILPLLLRIKDQGERSAALDDVAKALGLKVKDLRYALADLEK